MTLVVSADPRSPTEELIAGFAAERHPRRLPPSGICHRRRTAELCATTFTEPFRLPVVLCGGSCKGEKPADLPVQATAKFRPRLNLKTAKALGIDVPLSLLGRADEVIE